MAQTTGIKNTCTSCGGDLQYDLATNSNKCPYCGSTFKIKPISTQISPPEANVGCIAFQRDLSKFKEAVISFLCSGDLTSPNLLFEAIFQPAEQLYIPYYQFNGTYEGYYNSFDRRDKSVSQNTPLTGSYSVITYGGTDEADGKKMAAFIESLDQKLITPMDNIVLDLIRLTNSLSAKTTWECEGQPKAAGQVYQQLDKADANHRHEHHLQYHTQSAGKFYYPAWKATYSYRGDNYAIYMDGLSGELNGSKPEDLLIAPPSRQAVYKKSLLIGAGLWFGLMVVRAALAAFVGGHFDLKDHSMNNILFSEPAGLYWLLRGVIFLGVFPALMATVFYNRLVKAYYSKIGQLRSHNLNLIATGRGNIAFTQAGE